MITTIIFYFFVAILIFLQAVAIFFTFYQSIISFIGICLHNKKEDNSYFDLPFNRFAILVCAHNEEHVISQIIKNLKSLDYPKHQYDIHVIADNCTDNTAIITRESGAIAWERHNPSKKGKGFGLEWMFENLWYLERQGDIYDAVIVLDADNIVSNNFLQILNRKLMQGHEAIQTYLDSKNPKDTWITKSYALAYWITNEMYQKARYKMGLSAQLGGTGMCFSTKLIKEMGWGATSLTEDLEFTARYIMKTGKSVAWAHEAKLYDEKPLKFKQSWKQRIRWMQGHADCMMRYSGKLLWKSLKGSIKSFDMAIYLMQPGRVILSLLSLFYLAASYLNFLPEGMTKFILGHGVWNSMIIITYIFPIIGLFIAKKGKHILWVVQSYIFGWSWLPVITIGFFKRKQKEWVHTEHTRKLSTEELQNISIGA